MLRTADVEAPAPASQSYIERPPVPALAGLVSSVWIQQVSPGADPYTHRNTPHGGVELACRVGSVPRVVAEDRCSRGHDHAAAVGPLLRWRLLPVSARA